MSGPLQVQVGEKAATRVPLLFRDGAAKKAGVFARARAIGWGRLYMHLLKQAVVEGVVATDVEAQRRWAMGALLRMAETDPHATPDRISYDDAARLLQAAKAVKKPLIAEEPALEITPPHDKDLPALVALFPTSATRPYWWAPIPTGGVVFGDAHGPGVREPAAARTTTTADALEQYRMLSQTRRPDAIRREMTELAAALRALADDKTRGPDVMERAGLILEQIYLLLTDGRVTLIAPDLREAIAHHGMGANPVYAGENAKFEKRAREHIDAYVKARLTGTELDAARERLTGAAKHDAVLLERPLMRLFAFARGRSTVDALLPEEDVRDGVARVDDRVIVAAVGTVRFDAAFETGTDAVDMAELFYLYLHELMHTVGTHHGGGPEHGPFVEAITDVVAAEIRLSVPKLAPPPDPANPYSYRISAPRVRKALDAIPAAPRAAIIRKFLTNTPADTLFDELNAALPANEKLDLLGLDKP